MAALNEYRRARHLHAAAARFEPNLMYSAAVHNRRMNVRDSLYHDPEQHNAELIGTLYYVESWEPGKLARRIVRQLNESAPHRAIQEDSYIYVAVSAEKQRFVVRLSRSPEPRDPRQYSDYCQCP
ncbi:hypothetical protein [Hymenobacter fodinae]|uniref:SCP domain-containing protein n=1 Tax=Hymenobacter fodinae TaxID=2510796 RepID=A0A4Z0P609_9BACT|nr:hypothetical protein [Hymenobacter fodinae]TGE06097.1 hypothetical protein EU556_14615 [Hymenobacter fodinae]